MARGQRLALLALALAAWAQCVAGRITDAQIREDDRQIIQMAEPFGFGEGGRINISLAHFAARGVAPVGKDGKPGAKGPAPDASRLVVPCRPIGVVARHPGRPARPGRRSAEWASTSRRSSLSCSWR